MNISVSFLTGRASAEFKNEVALLSSVIQSGISIELVQGCLVQANSQQTMSLELAQKLLTILHTAIERGIGDDPHLSIIDGLFRRIIAQNPGCPVDLQAGCLLLTNHTFANPPSSDFIKAINSGVSLHELFSHKKAPEIVEWFGRNPSAAALLEYANFAGDKSFDNACLESLTRLCPNLQHLIICFATVSGDALKYLERIPHLKSLEIGWCTELEPDALKNLAFVQNLQHLNFYECNQLETDVLKRLALVKGLKSLKMSWCRKILEADALKHLVHVQDLQELDISGCHSLAVDSLKYLELVKKLQRLTMRNTSFEPDALKNLVHVPSLKYLDIYDCWRFWNYDKSSIRARLELIE